MPSRTPPKRSPLHGGEGQGLPRTRSGGEGSHRSLSDQGFRRALRQELTAAETKLWTLLRDRRLSDYKFRRQHTIGPYTVDVYYHEARLVVEVDGGIHDGPARNGADTFRQGAIEAQGLHVSVSQTQMC